MSARKGSIIIEGAATKAVRIVSTEGHVFSSFIAVDPDEISLSSGVYMVTVGNQTYKVMVK